MFNEVVLLGWIMLPQESSLSKPKHQGWETFFLLLIRGVNLRETLDSKGY